MPELPSYLDTWPGMEDPNYTPVPDGFFDVLLPILSDVEVRVLLYLIRRTYGFKKPADQVSLSQIVKGIRTRDGRQLDSGAGVSRAGAVLAVQRLEARGVLLVERRTSDDRGHEANTYAIRKAGPWSTKSTRVDHRVDQGGLGASLPVGNGVDPQETVQQTVNKREVELRCDALAGVIRADRPDLSRAERTRLLAAYRDAGGDYLAWWQQRKDGIYGR